MTKKKSRNPFAGEKLKYPYEPFKGSKPEKTTMASAAAKKSLKKALGIK